MIVVTVYSHDKETQKPGKAKAQIQITDTVRGTFQTMDLISKKLLNKKIKAGEPESGLEDDFMTEETTELYGKLAPGTEEATTEVGDYVSLKFISAPSTATNADGSPRRPNKPLPATMWQIQENGFFMPNEENRQTIEKAEAKA
jgi:hypothetical protein